MTTKLKLFLLTVITIGWSEIQAHAIKLFVDPSTHEYLDYRLLSGESFTAVLAGDGNRIYILGTFSDISVYEGYPQNPQPPPIAQNSCANIGYYVFNPGGAFPHIVNPMAGGVNAGITGYSFSGDDLTISGSFTQVGGASGFNGSAKWSDASLSWYPGIRIEKINDAVEGGTYGKFRIYRTGSTASSLVTIFTVGGTASGSDYSLYVNGGPEAPWGHATIASGATYATIDIVAIHDSVSDNNETVILTLSSDNAYVIGSPSAATVTITE